MGYVATSKKNETKFSTSIPNCIQNFSILLVSVMIIRRKKLEHYEILTSSTLLIHTEIKRNDESLQVHKKSEQRATSAVSFSEYQRLISPI